MRLLTHIILGVMLVSSPVFVWGQTKNQTLELIQQLAHLEAELRQLRGEVERLSYESKRMKTQQNSFYIDLDQRIQSIEKSVMGSSNINISPEFANTPDTGVGVTVPNMNVPIATTTNTDTIAGTIPSSVAPADISGSAPPAFTTASAVPVNPANEQADYKGAFNLLKSGKYNEAIAAYGGFLQRYPSGTYAANARYWLGEANYVTRQFPQALAEFRKVIDDFPQSRKSPDALLKIGFIHYELREFVAAREVLMGLKQKHPGTTAARLAENRLRRMKLEDR